MILAYTSGGCHDGDKNDDGPPECVKVCADDCQASHAKDSPELCQCYSTQCASSIADCDPDTALSIDIFLKGGCKEYKQVQKVGDCESHALAQAILVHTINAATADTTSSGSTVSDGDGTGSTTVSAADMDRMMMMAKQHCVEQTTQAVTSLVLDCLPKGK